MRVKRQEVHSIALLVPPPGGTAGSFNFWLQRMTRYIMLHPFFAETGVQGSKVPCWSFALVPRSKDGGVRMPVPRDDDALDAEQEEEAFPATLCPGRARESPW